MTYTGMGKDEAPAEAHLANPKPHPPEDRKAPDYYTTKAGASQCERVNEISGRAGMVAWFPSSQPERVEKLKPPLA